MKKWEIILKQKEALEEEFLNNGTFNETQFNQVIRDLKAALPVIEYTGYIYEDNKYLKKCTFKHTLILDSYEANLVLEEHQCIALEANYEGSSQLIEYMIIDNEQYAVILDSKNTLQNLLTKWAKSFKKTIVCYNYSRQFSHAAIYNKMFDVVTFN